MSVILDGKMVEHYKNSSRYAVLLVDGEMLTGSTGRTRYFNGINDPKKFDKMIKVVEKYVNEGKEVVIRDFDRKTDVVITDFTITKGEQ